MSSGSREVVMPALVNSGYETENPELLVPSGIAQALGLWPETREASMERYKVAGGAEIRVVRLRGSAKVEVLTGNCVSVATLCDVVVSEGEEELIISDKLAGSLGLSIIDIGEGTWCFKEEIGKKVRKSY
ncbi:MAG: hypothetical protein COX14_01420 [Chloroflexi bacterium CG23_combo_of_CG06-09_8_20_14_all_45_10]|nr:MAG: hypothetical protein COX14_01420 [Chloroflexi bacterium CG23_combo_of_CG06-09_8_20_14_all_45_10]